MFKKIIIAFIALTLVCVNFNKSSITQAASSSISSQNLTALPIAESINPTAPTQRQIVPKIVDGELDMESHITLTGTERKNYDNCRESEKQYRSARNKNKPTACFKQPKLVHEELMDQDYTTLIDRIQDKKDEDDKKDMKLERKLSEFIDINTITICNQKGFNKNSKVLSKLGLDSKKIIPTCEFNSNPIVSDSSLSLISSLISSSISVNSNSQVNTLSQISSQTSTVNSSISFLDFLFGTVKADAAGTIVYDYRFPYPTGTNVSTYRTFNDVATHTNHNAIDFWSTSNINNDIVAARAGTVVVSSGDTNNIGNYIVVLQDDGNYALYGHLSSRVAVNTVLKRGDYLGKQGKTGAAGTAEHLHFEVLQPGILNYTGGNITVNGSTNWSTCQSGWNSGFCYNVFTLDQFKVYPAYDECFVGRGGTQNNENNCKVSATGGNTGYPWISQSSPKYWTSINSLTPPPSNITQHVLFRDVNSGNNSIWKFANTSYTGDTTFPGNVGPDWKIAGIGDFNGDTKSDIFWRNSNTGDNVIWNMNNGSVTNYGNNFGTVPLSWSVAGIGDFNCDSKADIIWRNSDGSNQLWNMDNSTRIGDYSVQSVPTNWKIVSVDDFSGDCKADIFWRNNDGTNVIWNMNNSSIIPSNTSDVIDYVGTEFYVAGVADFNGDVKKDIFWRSSNNGSNVIWNMNNRAKNSSIAFNGVGVNDFIVGGLGDFNQDGKSDIFWRNKNGQQNVIWNMNNATVATSIGVGSSGTSNVQVRGVFTK
jgi:murein DD-endopeptidase MepM/ murein hydrolase activator NlpD